MSDRKDLLPELLAGPERDLHNELALHPLELARTIHDMHLGKYRAYRGGSLEHAIVLYHLGHILGAEGALTAAEVRQPVDTYDRDNYADDYRHRFLMAAAGVKDWPTFLADLDSHNPTRIDHVAARYGIFHGHADTIHQILDRSFYTDYNYRAYAALAAHYSREGEAAKIERIQQKIAGEKPAPGRDNEIARNFFQLAVNLHLRRLGQPATWSEARADFLTLVQEGRLFPAAAEVMMDVFDEDISGVEPVAVRDLEALIESTPTVKGRISLMNRYGLMTNQPRVIERAAWIVALNRDHYWTSQDLWGAGTQELYVNHDVQVAASGLNAASDSARMNEFLGAMVREPWRYYHSILPEVFDLFVREGQTELAQMWLQSLYNSTHRTFLFDENKLNDWDLIKSSLAIGLAKSGQTRSIEPETITFL